jgi:hypothetical protein
MVDDAPTFPEMLVQLEKWLDGHGLRDDDYLIDALWVTDGVSEQERLLLEFHTRADAPIRSLGIYGKPLQLAFPWSLSHADMVDYLSSVSQRFRESSAFLFPSLSSSTRRNGTALSGAADP